MRRLRASIAALARKAKRLSTRIAQLQRQATSLGKRAGKGGKQTDERLDALLKLVRAQRRPAPATRARRRRR